MTVLAGSVIATFATTGVRGVPLSFLVLAVALLLFTVGYVAMARYVSNAGVFYAYLAQGLGRIWGVAGALVALVSYNAIQISLYGLFGFTMSGLLGSGVSWPWWVWSAGAWAVVALLGVLHISINARVLAVLLICEVGMILLFDFGSFTHPFGGSISLTPMQPGALFVQGIGGVFAFGIAAFVGYESAPVYGEEARGHSAVARSSFGSLAFIGVLYAVSSWALAVAVGPDQVAASAADSVTTGIPFSILSDHYGGVVADLANVLLITSVFGALLSFHNGVARYVFALSRERVLPAALDRIGSGSGAGAPIGGSLVQSAIALVVGGAFALSGANPLTTLFTWLSTVAALGVMLLMFGTSLAVIGFFRRGAGGTENAWQRLIAPALGAGVLLVVLGTTVWNIKSVLGTAANSPLTWILPGIIALAAIGGVVWGAILRRNRPEIYRTIGQGQAEPLEVLEHALAHIHV